MTTISNKTQRPLSVPLPGGKTLHLGPGKSGEIAAKASEHPQLKKLVDAGEIEIVGEGPGSTDESGAASEGGVDGSRRPAAAAAASGDR